ncbi:MAG: hypothetical protein K2M97_08240 [Muribaculaceae bacterium]|nr:hypothetical protein [Muribaculaceae bacterium]
MKTLLTLTVSAAILMSASCSSSRNAEAPAPTAAPVADRTIAPGEKSPTVKALPKAVVYRTSKPAADLVPVQLNASGGLMSYPAPTDLTDDSTPIALADGWWLDRRGVTPHTVFTHWTYAEYRAMKQAPTSEEIIKAIEPGMVVTECRTLDMTPSAAAADTAAVNALIRNFRPTL